MDDYDEFSVESIERKYSNHTRNQLITEIRMLMFENKSLKSDVARLLDSLTIYKEMPSIEEHMRRVLTNLQNASELSENLVEQSQRDTSRERAHTKKRPLEESKNGIHSKRHMSEVIIKEEYDAELSMENLNDYDSTEYLDHNYWNSFETVAENSVKFARMNNNSNEALENSDSSEQKPEHSQSNINHHLNVDFQEEQSLGYENYNYQQALRKWGEEGSEEENIFKEGLETILRESMEGKQILKLTGIFQEVHRRNLTKIVINYLNTRYAVNSRIPIMVFEKAAEEIEKTFPQECKLTYFVPPKKKTKTTPSIGASGKLWAKYYNMKRQSKNPNSLTADNLPADSSGSEEATIGVDEQTAFQYLQGNVEINAKLLDCWKQSYHIRKQFIDKQEIEQYFNTVPALKLIRGYQLLLEDFTIRYNDKTFKLYQKWANISKKIIKLSKFRKLVPKNSPDIHSDLGILILLPQLFQSTRKANSAFRVRRNSIQDTFCLVVNDEATMHTAIEKRRAEASEGKELLPPFMTAIVKDSKVVSTYVVLEYALYKTDSVIHCLDTCFKIFFTLNAKYPLECKPVWMFIQTYIYEIETTVDRIYTSVQCAISDMEKLA